MNDDLLPCVEIEPEGPARSAVLWLHGLGADGHDFEPIVPELGLPAELGVRFVFPHAPSIPVTLNGRMVMPAWYDIGETDLRVRHDEEGILRSSQRIEALIARERERGIPSERIVLAGFSQGGAIATHVALRHAEPLAGAMGLSCYLVRPASLPGELHPSARALRVFLAHGTHDPMVPFAHGEDLRRRLEALGLRVEWKQYPMMHQVCSEEIEDIGAWLTQVLTRVLS